MKVALCFFGQPRYIDSDRIPALFKKAIHAQADVDVFTHFWFKDGETELSQSEWSYSKNLSVAPNTVERVKELYDPIVMEYEPQIDFTPDQETKDIINKLPFQKFNQDKNIFNVKSQLYSINRVIELLQRYMVKNCITYDFAIITRFDIILKTFPVLKNLKKGKFYLGGYPNVGGTYPGFNDYVHILDPELLEGCKAFYDFKKLVSKANSLCIEEIKQIKLKQTYDYLTTVEYISDQLLSEIARAPF